jgi:DNA-binding PadR family transcriptional regulator
MRLLTRTEEFVLLAVWRLQHDAYSVRISEELEEITGDAWSLGSVYMPLNRLRKQGLVRTFLSDATPERGGRPKRMYRLTDKGVRALVELKDVQSRLWMGIRELRPGVAK